MIDRAKLTEEILSDGNEDYYGLYEILWSLNTTYPTVPREEKLNAALAAFAPLLAEGRVMVFRTLWASGAFEPVPKDEAVAAVSNPAAWDDPTERPYFCYATA